MAHVRWEALNRTNDLVNGLDQWPIFEAMQCKCNTSANIWGHAVQMQPLQICIIQHWLIWGSVWSFYTIGFSCLPKNLNLVRPDLYPSFWRSNAIGAIVHSKMRPIKGSTQRVFSEDTPPMDTMVHHMTWAASKKLNWLNWDWTGGASLVSHIPLVL